MGGMARGGRREESVEENRTERRHALNKSYLKSENGKKL